MAIVITRQPQNAQGATGATVTFTVEATGASSYTWQISEDGSTWSSLVSYGWAGADTDTLSVEGISSYHFARPYRCLLSDASGNQMTTDVVTITQIALCAITKHPADVIAAAGDTVSFTVEAENTTYYLWQRSTDGGASWVRITSQGDGSTLLASSSISVAVTQENMSDLYRCELRDVNWVAAYTGAVGVMSEVKRSFAFTGGVQVFTIPVSGIYKMTAVGANGASYADGTYGGRAIGYKEFKRGDVIHICCGQAGAFDGKATYNGGGAGIVPDSETWNNPSGSGGGATHIATQAGTLAEIDAASVIIAAGGSGGGSYGGSYTGYEAPGGYGGGESGGYGGVGTTWGSQTGAAPGTQSEGYNFGRGQSVSTFETADGIALPSGAGGGGYYGGYAGAQRGFGGAGGSGYIGGVEANITYKGVTYTPGMTDNYNSAGTDGYAIIELAVKTTLPVTFDGTVLESIVMNGVEITGLIVDGVRVFTQKLKRRLATWCTSTNRETCLSALT